MTFLKKIEFFSSDFLELLCFFLKINYKWLEKCILHVACKKNWKRKSHVSATS